MPGMILSTQGEQFAESTTASRSDSALEDERDMVLARRSRTGDMDAFGQLVTRHEKRVAALVGRILGTRATADDVDDTVQDVFVQAWKALPKFRGDARFSTWLYRIATNMAIREWHRRKRVQNVVSEEELPDGIRVTIADPGPTPADVAERKARSRAIAAAIERLPEKHRTVVLLHYYEDHSCEEIALIIGCSVGTVWSRLHYACRKLQGTLDWPQFSS